MPSRITIEDIRKRLTHTSLVCTEEAYKYPQLDMGFTCHQGHSFTMTWAEMARRVRGGTVHCPLCKYGDCLLTQTKKL